MLNQKHNVHKRTNSKILLIILCIFGLLFSWSCSCKNRVSDPNETPINGGITNKKPDETPTGTFSMSAATDNVTDNFIVKSDSTSGEIKIAFVSANNYAYTSSYEVVDNDTTEANRITTAETTYANNVLTIKDTALAKVRQLDSSGGPAEKTITINFTFKANDASLKNNTQTLSVEVKLTKALELSDNKSLIDYIVKVLKTSSEKPFIVGYDNDSTLLEYLLNEAVNNNEKLEFKATTNNEEAKTFSKVEVKRKIINGLNKELKNHGVKETVQSDANLATTTTDGDLSFKVKLTFEDSYEAKNSEVEIIVKKTSYNNTWEDTERPSN